MKTLPTYEIPVSGKLDVRRSFRRVTDNTSAPLINNAALAAAHPRIASPFSRGADNA